MPLSMFSACQIPQLLHAEHTPSDIVIIWVDKLIGALVNSTIPVNACARFSKPTQMAVVQAPDSELRGLLGSDSTSQRTGFEFVLLRQP